MLRALQEAVLDYEEVVRARSAAGARQHPDLVKEMVEPAVRRYLADVLPERMRVGSGFPIDRDEAEKPSPAQIDVVIDWDGTHWRQGVHVGVEPVYLGLIEVRYRGDWLTKRRPEAVWNEIADPFERLQALTDRAVAERKKCWTSCVLLGRGFDLSPRAPETMTRDQAVKECDRRTEAFRAVLRRLYEHQLGYHEDVDEMRPNRLGRIRRSWPFPDALVLPSLSLKKHVLFEKPELRYDLELPAYIAQPAASTDAYRDVRPLSTLKGHLRHVLKSIAGERDFSDSAWSDEECSVYLGPYPSDADIEARFRATLLSRRRPGVLYFAGGDARLNPEWATMVPDTDAGEPVYVENGRSRVKLY
ncbi:MAG: hypothetical protein EVA89_17220 [Sandaracinaceae bacterium]|nr:MAG: hypothetical protein EVA89_17220 [Sandaracinaceae bacterium]